MHSDGYGVGYAVHPDRVEINISHFTNSTTSATAAPGPRRLTSCQRMCEEVCRALHEVRDVFSRRGGNQNADVTMKSRL